MIDLDTSKDGRDAVLRDAAAITALVSRCGGGVIADESPSGGIHLYVPLGGAVPFHDARNLALALAACTPTMDPTPNTNLLHGLIRPPGSVHKSGGHQMLRGSLAAAYDLARRGNPEGLWQRLTAELADDISAVENQRSAASDIDPSSPIERPGDPRELTGAYLTIATMGNWDRNRYESPSEARQAVITSAAWAGFSLPQIANRLATGIWPGLAALYARYAPGARHKALARDWSKARSLVEKHRANASREESVRKSHTSEPTSHRPPVDPSLPTTESNRGSASEYRWIRSWWNALLYTERTRYTGRGGPAIRMVLRALGEAAMKTGSRYVAFGTRSVAVATGLDHSTVAAHLRTLRGEDNPLVVLLESERGLQGDLYELRIPEDVASRVETAAWKPGKIRALRPVFRALGLPAAYVFEALEMAREPVTSFELAQVTRLGRSTVYEALETLAAYGLAHQTGGRWQLGDTGQLQPLAEVLGCLADIDELLGRHRVERAAWRAVLGGSALLVETIRPAQLYRPWDMVASPPASPNHPDTETVIDLLQHRLGARIVTEHSTIGGPS